MKLNIDEIKIPKNRIRKETGTLSPLMSSMKKYGLLQPIIIDKDFVLLAGFRRYQAATKLGWREIEAKVVDVEKKLDKLEIEIEENEVRKNFTLDEVSYAVERKEKLSKPSLLRMIWEFIKRIIFKIK